MFPIDLIVMIFFSSWFIVTIVRNIPSRFLPAQCQKLLCYSTLTRFIPSWRFFAPTPGIHTYHILYRDQSIGRHMSKWHEILFNTKNRLYPVWNPSKTFNKAIIDIIFELSQSSEVLKGHPEMIKVSIPYLTILAYISGIPRLSQPLATQFLLIRSSPTSGYEIVFLSDLHEL